MKLRRRDRQRTSCRSRSRGHDAIATSFKRWPDTNSSREMVARAGAERRGRLPERPDLAIVQNAAAGLLGADGDADPLRLDTAMPVITSSSSHHFRERADLLRRGSRPGGPCHGRGWLRPRAGYRPSSRSAISRALPDGRHCGGSPLRLYRPSGCRRGAPGDVARHDRLE